MDSKNHLLIVRITKYIVYRFYYSVDSSIGSLLYFSIDTTWFYTFDYSRFWTLYRNSSKLMKDTVVQFFSQILKTSSFKWTHFNIILHCFEKKTKSKTISSRLTLKVKTSNFWLRLKFSFDNLSMNKWTIVVLSYVRIQVFSHSCMYMWFVLPYSLKRMNA